MDPILERAMCIYRAEQMETQIKSLEKGTQQMIVSTIVNQHGKSAQKLIWPRTETWKVGNHTSDVPTCMNIGMPNIQANM